MPRQSTLQRWCCLIMLGVLAGLLVYFALPVLAYRVGRSVQAGRADQLQEEAELLATARQSATIKRLSDRVGRSVVRVAAHPRQAPAPAHADLSPNPAVQHSPAAPAGCGVIIDERGLVLTACALVQDAERVFVYLPQRDDAIAAEIAAIDLLSHLAVLRFPPPEALMPINQIAADLPHVGEFVLAIGGAEHQEPVAWPAIISARGRADAVLCRDADDFIHTSTSVAPYDGTPLVNLEGDVVGISVLGGRHTATHGLAVPALVARRVVEELRRFGAVRRGWLGAFLRAARVPSLPLPTASNLAARVEYVVPGSPADRAGLRAGDQIVQFQGEPVQSTARLQRRILATLPGTDVALAVLRDQQVHFPVVTLGGLPDSAPLLPGEAEWGIRLEIAPYDGAPDPYQSSPGAGMLVNQICPQCRLESLHAGDQIVAIDGTPTPNLEAYCRLAQAACRRGQARIAVRSGERLFELQVAASDRAVEASDAP